MCATANLWQIRDAVCSIVRIFHDSTGSQSSRFAAELVRMSLASAASKWLTAPLDCEAAGAKGHWFAAEVARVRLAGTAQRWLQCFSYSRTTKRSRQWSFSFVFSLLTYSFLSPRP